jgi:hypothetical protein
MKQKISYLEIKLVFGLVTLVVGLLAANLALFHWVERTGFYYLFGEYARYVCAYGGFAAMIFGAMLINDFLVLKSIMKKKCVVADKAITSFYGGVKEKDKKRIADTERKNRRQTIAAASLAIFLFMLCPLVVSSMVSYTATVVITPTTSFFQYGYAFISSDTRVSIDDTVDPVDDPEAVLNITLTTDSHVFIVYNAGNELGSTEDAAGKGCAINIDGSDVAFSWQSPYSDNKANSVTVVYATYLTAGSHVIKGRFFGLRTKSGAGVYTVGIDKRQLVAFWFPTVTAAYVRSTTSVSTTSGTPVDDPEAILNVTLSEESVAFIVYNAGNQRGSILETPMGITLNIDGTDILTRQWQSPYAANEANSVTIAYVTNLTVGSHTIKGRFFSVGAGSVTTIDERQLIVFCFPADVVTGWFKESATSVSTTSGTPVDDSEAVLSGTLTTASDCLMMYVGGNPNGVTEDYDGKGVLLNIDGTDISNSTSWQSPYQSDWANSVTSLWCEEKTAGSHNIKGRFFASYPGYTVTISHRQLLFLAFPKP